MSINLLFPILVEVGLTDLQEPILKIIDNESLVALSCTNKNAYSALTNNKFFKERFMELYRSFSPTPEKLFPNFQEYYPDCCWKISSCLYPDANPIVVFNKTFLQKAPPYSDRINEKEIEKCTLENDLQSICGIGFADPNSRILQVWESYQAALKSKEESMHMLEIFSNEYDEHEQRRQGIKDNHSEGNSLEKAIYLVLESELTLGEIPLLTKRRTELQDQGPLVFRALETYRIALKAHEDVRIFEELYKDLKDVKVKAEARLELLPKEIDTLINDGHRDIHIHLLVDQYFVMNNFSKDNYKQISQLNAYLNWIIGCKNCIAPKDLVSTLSRLSPEWHSIIFEILYHACANGANEEHWAEMHCAEFCPQIARICKQLMFNYEKHWK